MKLTYVFTLLAAGFLSQSALAEAPKAGAEAKAEQAAGLKLSVVKFSGGG